MAPGRSHCRSAHFQSWGAVAHCGEWNSAYSLNTDKEYACSPYGMMWIFELLYTPSSHRVQRIKLCLFTERMRRIRRMKLSRRGRGLPHDSNIPANWKLFFLQLSITNQGTRRVHFFGKTDSDTKISCKRTFKKMFILSELCDLTIGVLCTQ